MEIRAINGFTILEVMVTISIFITLLIGSLPLISSWSETLAITDAKGKIKHAVSTARATAQFNTFGVELKDASAAVCIQDNVIIVRSASALGSAACSNQSPIKWSSQLPKNIEIFTSNGVTQNNFQCLCFRPSGLTSVDGNCNMCSRINFFRIKKGDSNELLKIS